METNETHYLEQRITDYLNGKLTEKEAEILWDELILEPELLEYLKTEIALRNHFNQKPKSQPIFWLYSVAAALFLVSVGLNLFRYSESDYVRNQLDLTRIADTELELTHQFRDSAKQLTAEDSMFIEALNYTYSGQFERARGQFLAYAQRFPVSVSASKAYLNIGILLYNEKNYTDAIVAFDDAFAHLQAESRFFSEKLYWYRGNAFFQLRDLTKARSDIFEAYQLDGPYHQQAFELLRYLDTKLGKVDYKTTKD